MKTNVLKIAVLVLASVGMLSISSCEKEKEVKNLSVSNLNYTDCLSESKDTFSKDPSNSDSIAYSYQNHILYITHHNLVVGCGEELHVDVQLRNDTIRIAEWTDGYVDCVCKIDNSFQINDLEKGSYILNFVNPGITLPVTL